MRDFLREDDDMSNEDEIRVFLRATATTDVDIDPLRSWSVISKHFPTIVKLAQFVLSSQATSVTSEGVNSPAENLINSYRTSLDDVAIEASLSVQS